MDLTPGTLSECKELFKYFETTIVKKVTDNPTYFSAKRVDYIKSIISDGVEKYRERTNYGADDRCITGKYHIQLYRANKPEEIAEYILSGFSFEVQREMFGT
jgi:hypothetical protein